MLVAEGLRKAYSNASGTTQAVAEVSLRVSAGEILGMLGPNGAGKSTTVGMICGLVMPDEGQVRIAGEVMSSSESAANNAQLKRRIGLVPQDLALFDDLSAERNLRIFGALYGLGGNLLAERVQAALELVGLLERAKDKPSTFSGGMKRRLNIAAALVHDPDVLLLDEPTVGVDPQSRNAIFENLETLRKRGKALIYTTHYMEEAERLADRIVIIDHGKVVAQGTLATLTGSMPARETWEVHVQPGLDAAMLAAVPGVHEVRRTGEGRATLEDVFLAHTGRQLRD